MTTADSDETVLLRLPPLVAAGPNPGGVTRPEPAADPAQQTGPPQTSSIQRTEPARGTEPAPSARPAGRGREALVDLAFALPLTTAVLVLLAWNIDGFPAASDDEGTYLAQAWAVQQGEGLAHYTYWYDHPPLGWIQIALLSWLPAELFPHALAVAAGRAVMLPVAGASLVLVYLLSRRLCCSRWTAALALLAYGLSPLSVTMMRQIYLDSFAVMWILLAFVLALSPRRHLWHHAGAGVAVAIGVLSKETMLVVVPAVVVALWQGTARTSVRPWAFAGFLNGLAMVGVFYPLYAALKGEFVPGDGHVSLIGAWLFQLQERTGSGSVFTEGSSSNLLLHAWLYYDAILLVGGVVAACLAVAVRRLRPLAVAVALLALVAIRPGGYLPAMYVLQALPFLAILLAAIIQIVVTAILARPLPPVLARRRAGAAARGLRWAVVGAIAVAAVGYVAPRWYDGDRRAVVSQANDPYLAAARWLRTGVADRAEVTVVTDNVLWLDLVGAGYRRDRVIWFYKLDLDPAVRARLARGWRDVDYIISTPAMRQDPNALPTVAALLRNSTAVRTFGTGDDRVEVRRVSKEAP